MILKLVSDKLSVSVIFSTYHYQMGTILNIAKDYEARVFILDDTGRIADEVDLISMVNRGSYASNL